jgi:hypothetical protein
MRKPDTELAIRPATTRKVVYKHVPHETQYVIAHTLIGEAALCWTAQWLAGLFSIEDFPADIAAYVQNVLLGSQWERRLDDSLEAVARGAGPFAAVAEALLRGQYKLHTLALPTCDQSTLS